MRSRLSGALRSQWLGVVLGQLTVALFAIGSVVLVLTRDGASAGVHGDDVTAFFLPLSPVHWWLYLLIAVLALYALNTALCTWDAVWAKWHAGVRSLPAYAAAVMHLGFLVLLLAHLVGGTLSQEGAPVIISAAPTTLDDGRVLVLEDLDNQTWPGGMPRAVNARVHIQNPDGTEERATIGYNHPWSAGLGSDLLILAKAGRVAGGPAVALRVRHAPGNPLDLLGGLLLVVGVLLMGRRWLPSA